MRSLGDYYMLTEASEALGISQFLLRKWIADSREGYLPSRTATMGKTRIYLYTEDDLERIKTLHEQDQSAQEFRTAHGRPRRYTDAQRVARNRLHSKRYYWRLRRDEAAFRGDAALLERAHEQVSRIEEQLRASE